MPDSITLEVGDAVLSWTGITYRIIKFLGQGGSASAYLTVCTEGKHRGLSFAVKAFRSASKPDRIISFMREINVLRNCEHPAIMRVFDEGIYQERYPFVVVEYLPRTLHDEIRSTTNFLKNIAYSLHLLSALDYLQRLIPAVIHRDIKPKNIFVKGGSCILGDFGLLKHWQVPDNQNKDIIKESRGPGMPRFYRTPDLVRHLREGLAPTTSSDVFQLGLVLAELFTGSNPEVPMKANRFTEDVKLKPLRNVRHPLWPPVKDAIESMLVFDPDARPSPDVLSRLFLDFYLSETHRIEEQAKKPKK